jgi:hypothetical protein
VQFIGQNSKHDSFWMIVIKQPAAVITRERDEVNEQGIINSSRLIHAGILLAIQLPVSVSLPCNPDIQSDVRATLPGSKSAMSCH